MAVGRVGGEQTTLKGVQARFEQWRQRRERLGPIPEELWAAAAELTRNHTYLEVSRALRLNYNDLKKRARALPVRRGHGEKAGSRFVQVDLCGLDPAGGQFVLEWEGEHGGKLRVQVRGKSDVDVAGVVCALGAWAR